MEKRKQTKQRLTRAQWKWTRQSCFDKRIMLFTEFPNILKPAGSLNGTKCQQSSSLKMCTAQQLEATHLLQTEPLDRAVHWLIVYSLLPIISCFFLSLTSSIKISHKRCCCLCWGERGVIRQAVDLMVLRSYTDAVFSAQGRSKGRGHATPSLWWLGAD